MLYAPVRSISSAPCTLQHRVAVLCTKTGFPAHLLQGDFLLHGTTPKQMARHRYCPSPYHAKTRTTAHGRDEGHRADFGEAAGCRRLGFPEHFETRGRALPTRTASGDDRVRAAQRFGAPQIHGASTRDGERRVDKSSIRQPLSTALRPGQCRALCKRGRAPALCSEDPLTSASTPASGTRTCRCTCGKEAAATGEGGVNEKRSGRGYSPLVLRNQARVCNAAGGQSSRRCAWRPTAHP